MNMAKEQEADSFRPLQPAVVVLGTTASSVTIHHMWMVPRGKEPHVSIPLRLINVKKLRQV